MKSIPLFRVDQGGEIPEWALLERKLIQLIDGSSLEFADRYTNSDNTLIWRKEWPGFDGSDENTWRTDSSMAAFMHCMPNVF